MQIRIYHLVDDAFDLSFDESSTFLVQEEQAGEFCASRTPGIHRRPYRPCESMTSTRAADKYSLPDRRRATRDSSGGVIRMGGQTTVRLTNTDPAFVITLWAPSKVPGSSHFIPECRLSAKPTPTITFH
ncbi:hypothetical protein FRB95_008246 [Tulasnella sp. JGI-2019a]|nr:hypothetical protein FRB95_008246 [Tulasnella sp. JGI-2019a]